jgi:glycosyltransferase involved in cell wall biosynthesis
VSTNFKVLLISQGEFSGVRPALMTALERSGCEVIYRRQSLRELGLRRYWCILRMIAESLLVYRADARQMIERTRAAYVARSRVSKALVDQHPGVDVVMLLAANSTNYWGARPPAIRFVIYTDYMNLLSKALPDYGFALDERKTHPQWNVLERQTLLEQDHIFVMGSHVKPAIESAYGIPAAKITAVGAGPGLDLDVDRDGHVKDYANRSILFVGKEADKKGLRVLLRAFSEVRKRYPDAVLHVVTGQPVSGPGVVFHGSLDPAALKNLFYTSSIFAMPAFKEPLGLVFLEAMWSKTVCIGTTTGSMPEIIRDGETGYLVEPGDHAALTARIFSLLGDPGKLQRMSERGYAAAKSYWRWDGVVERMRHVLADARPADSSGTPQSPR